MKIQPIIQQIYHGKLQSSKTQYTTNNMTAPISNESISATQNSNIPFSAYQANFLATNKSNTVSFAAADRTYSTDKKKLAERSGDFIISKMSGITCPSCGKKMLNRTKFEKIAHELADLPADEYLDCLGKYTDFMRPVEESVYNELLELSEETGTKDVRTLLVNLRDSKMPVLQKAQMRQIKKMRALAKTLPDDEQKVLTRRLNSLQKEIRNHNTTAPFRRKVMIERISKIKIRNPRKYEKLQEIAKSFPTSHDMNSAWIIKYSGKNKMNEDWNSYNISLRLLSSSIANTDHILAYDIENNHDDISNYMSMHNACNAIKSNKPFMQWLHEDKDKRIGYMTDYFNEVDELIQSKRIKKKKYRQYVAFATQTIFEVTKGDVRLYDLLNNRNQQSSKSKSSKTEIEIPTEATEPDESIIEDIKDEVTQ